MFWRLSLIAIFCTIAAPVIADDLSQFATSMEAFSSCMEALVTPRHKDELLIVIPEHGKRRSDLQWRKKSLYDCLWIEEIARLETMADHVLMPCLGVHPFREPQQTPSSEYALYVRCCCARLRIGWQFRLQN